MTQKNNKTAEEKPTDTVTPTQRPSPRDVVVSITPTAAATTFDSTNLCMIVGESDVEVKPFLVDDMSYADQLAALAAQNPNTDLAATKIPLALDNLNAAFSTQSNVRKRYMTVGFAKDGNATGGITTWSDFFDQRSVDVSLYFGFIHYVTGRTHMASYADFAAFCNSNSIFFSFWEDDSSIGTLPEETFLIAFTHKQKDSNGDLTNGFLQATVLPYICYQLQQSPNFNTYTVLNGTVNLASNVFTEAQRKTYEDKFINQYFYRNGLTRFRLGTVTAGKKIEEIYSMQVYVPQDLQASLETYQANTDLKVSDVISFEVALSTMLSKYETMRITAPAPSLGNSSFSIDSVTVGIVNGIAQFNAAVRIAYNDNIVNINIKGTQVEATIGT